MELKIHSTYPPVLNAKRWIERERGITFKLPSGNVLWLIAHGPGPWTEEEEEEE